VCVYEQHALIYQFCYSQFMLTGTYTSRTTCESQFGSRLA